MEKNEFPAKLVLGAIRKDEMKEGQHRIVCFADSVTLESEDDLDRRHGFYNRLEAGGGWPYTYTLCHIDDLDEAMADIKATLQAELDGTPAPEPEPRNEAGDANTPPAGEDPPAKEEPEQDDTTNTDDGQGTIDARPEIVLTVEYHGTGAAITPTGDYPGATCRLVHYRDGRNNRPPDDNVARLRLWLKRIGYEPNYPLWAWLKRGAPPRRRREVYRYVGPTNDLYDETLDQNALRQFARETPTSRLTEAERLALYRTKALAGEGVFAPCRDCPLVQDCPHGWGACQRKADYLKAQNANKSRYQLFVPGLIG